MGNGPLRNWLVGACLLLPAGLLGHMDPVGDVHPHVSVKNGMFVVEFNNNKSQELNHRSEFRVVYSKEGDVILPRHPIEKRSAIFKSGWYGGTTQVVGDKVYRVDENAQVLQELVDDKVVATHPLGWKDGKPPLEIFEDFLVVEDSLYILGTLLEMDRGYDDPKLQIARFSLDQVGPPEVYPVGAVASIYHFPTCSGLQLVGDKICLAWMGEHPEKERKRSFLLTALDTKENRMQTKELPDEYYWNTQVSLAAIGHRICIAWHHGRIYGEFQESKIKTIFMDLSE